MKLTLKFVAIIAIATTALVNRSFAVNYSFDNGDGNNMWVDGINWNPNAPAGGPTAADNARVGTTAFPTETAILDGTDAGNANNVRLGFDAGTTGTVNMFNHSTLNAANNFFVGDVGTGNLNMFDHSTLTIGGNLNIGSTATGVGTVILHNNAILNLPGAASVLNVGLNGIGRLEIHGNATVGTTAVTNPINMFIGRNAGSVGFALVDGGVLTTFNDAAIGGNLVAVGGTGTLKIINGGSVSIGNGAGGGSLIVWGTNAAGFRSVLGIDASSSLTVSNTLQFNGGQLNFIGDGVVAGDPGSGDNIQANFLLSNQSGPDLDGMFANVTDSNTATIDAVLVGDTGAGGGTRGDLTKTGTGTLVITNNANTYRDTIINNGTLEVGAFDALGLRDTVVNNGGTLRTVEGAPLKYNIFRNLVVNSGGLFYAQVGGTAAGQFDQANVLAGGDAFLNTTGSHLFVHRINNYNPNIGDTVTIINTTVPVVGFFSDAPEGTIAPNDFLGNIQPFTHYDGVHLIFGLGAPFVTFGKTPNQIAVGKALDAAFLANCIVPAINFVGNIPIGSLRHSYDLIAAEELASIYESSFGQSMAQSFNMQHRMDDIRWGSTGFCADGFVIQDNHGYTKNDGKNVADKNPVEQVAPPNYRWGTFVTGTGELTKVGGEDDNADGYQLNNASFTMGADYRFSDHFAIGVSGGYTNTRARLIDDGRMTTDGGRLGIYGTFYTGGFYVDASATGGWNQYDTRRTALVGQERGSTDGGEFNGMLAAGFDWKRGCWVFGPYADVEYDYVEFNAFTESDSSVIPLHFPDQNQDAIRTNLGFRVAHEQVMKPGEGLTVVPEMRAAWRHDFGDNSYAIDSNFVGCSDVFTVHGPWIGSDSAVVDIGLTAYCTQQLSASIFYQGQFGRDNYNNNAITGGLRFAF